MDQLTEKHQLPSTRFGIKWMVSSVTAHSSSVRRIDLLGIRGPNNYFTIFLPKKALQEAERNREGMVIFLLVCLCVCVCVCVCVQVQGFQYRKIFEEVIMRYSFNVEF